jgi:hypothetical protein
MKEIAAKIRDIFLSAHLTDDDAIDYTFYDKNGLNLDGGQLDLDESMDTENEESVIRLLLEDLDFMGSYDYSEYVAELPNKEDVDSSVIEHFEECNELLNQFYAIYFYCNGSQPEYADQWNQYLKENAFRQIMKGHTKDLVGALEYFIEQLSDDEKHNAQQLHAKLADNMVLPTYMNYDGYFGLEKVFISKVDSYVNGDALYIALSTMDEETGEAEPFSDLTVCLSAPLESNLSFVDICNNPGAAKLIEQYGLGKPTGKYRQSGFNVYPLYEFDMDKIHELWY